MSESTSLAPVQAIEQALIQGDLTRLTPDEKVAHYLRVCESLGLNPHTQPFDYVILNGKLTLYAKKGCTDQLRSLRNVTVEVISRDIVDECLIVHARATISNGKSKRTDEDLGVVSLGKLQGEARANAIMRAITKAKRRVTLSICGLGFLDETELPPTIEVIAQEQPAPRPAPQPAAPPALPAPSPPKKPGLITDPQKDAIDRLTVQLAIPWETFQARIVQLFGTNDPTTLDSQQADSLIRMLEAKAAGKPKAVAS